ncbi:putative mitochondrial pyruvate carrier 2 [Fulvia fulva]|uniref:Mitochondrial pyruvate carrier n=1 Tax=Passalora fulva TaxID=5499 RepID=A0A9Q8L7N3_PASFU|nr:putative mitochondrial pyruvate carrier 2 [Fulvia fulva]KAK4635402.1 putative mitochondrial pyruvate carrier 2 [Fulvia fulva]KAK4636591.1 putative mitochondrial pyruvate carrier 2 [Fulvia fulva]UJO12219.1 putative mitochondrial pyruvate carrier 2 [Fulvia fulva]WPV08713.1 putative mitochondrial pyruvate carrier 2 [Fulvia fulva]WPV24390.1 putative mitochondrial pyruvate carrier 2 [Fulvia fulva]
MASRFGLRAAQTTFRQPVSRQNINRFAQRRVQSTAADATASNESGFSKFWNSKVGPKTVHFWAPIMKWGLVLAGAADFARPAKDLSLSQNAALMATGLIWTRWCFVIKPRNLFLASVNFLLFCVGATQVSRVLSYQSSLKNEGVGEVLKEDAKAEGKHLEKAAGQAEKAVEKKL